MELSGFENERPDVPAEPLAGALHTLGYGRNQLSEVS